MFTTVLFHLKLPNNFFKFDTISLVSHDSNLNLTIILIVYNDNVCYDNDNNSCLFNVLLIVVLYFICHLFHDERTYRREHTEFHVKVYPEFTIKTILNVFLGKEAELITVIIP